VEAATGKRFGDPSNPLLVSVRSGARASMPGMMDTVLNLGLNDETAEGLANLSGDRRFAFDSYRRFIQMYSNVVLDLDHHLFEEVLDETKARLDAQVDTDLEAQDWEAVVQGYKAVVRQELGRDFPQDANEQLWGAIGAVFASWMNDRAKFYRRMHDIPESWGTAVNVQSMVFGNMGETSATGVAFTRNPSTGEARLYGEFLINAQGEDVVAGIRTPQALTRAAREEMGERAPSMEEAMPEVFAEFKAVVERLERHYRDMQDVEFTVENGRLFMLQTRSGKRTAKAALRTAVEMAGEGLITRARRWPRRSRLAGPAAAPDARPRRRAHDRGRRPARLAGRRQRQGGVRRRRGRAPGLGRGGRHPGASGDQPGGHPRHARRQGHRHGPGRHDQPRRRGGARDGPSLRQRSRRAQHRREGQDLHRPGTHHSRGRVITIDGSKGEVLLGAIATLEPELRLRLLPLMEWADKVRRLPCAPMRRRR
jgi:pyruvate,orthophosphate dikinase